MNKLVSAVFIFLISACASTQNSEKFRKPYVLENQLESTSGKIINKKIVGVDEVVIPKTESELREEFDQIERDLKWCSSAAYYQHFSESMKKLGLKPYSKNQVRKECEETFLDYKEGYLYTIKNNLGSHYEAYSFYGDFDIGDCVELLIGKSTNRVDSGVKCK